MQTPGLAFETQMQMGRGSHEAVSPMQVRASLSLMSWVLEPRRGAAGGRHSQELPVFSLAQPGMEALGLSRKKTVLWSSLCCSQIAAARPASLGAAMPQLLAELRFASWLSRVFPCWTGTQEHNSGTQRAMFICCPSPCSPSLATSPPLCASWDRQPLPMALFFFIYSNYSLL